MIHGYPKRVGELEATLLRWEHEEVYGDLHPLDEATLFKGVRYLLDTYRGVINHASHCDGNCTSPPCR